MIQNNFYIVGKGPWHGPALAACTRYRKWIADCTRVAKDICKKAGIKYDGFLHNETWTDSFLVGVSSSSEFIPKSVGLKSSGQDSDWLFSASKLGKSFQKMADEVRTEPFVDFIHSDRKREGFPYGFEVVGDGRGMHICKPSACFNLKGPRRCVLCLAHDSRVETQARDLPEGVKLVSVDEASKWLGVKSKRRGGEK